MPNPSVRGAMQQCAALATDQQGAIGQHGSRPKRALIAGIQIAPAFPIVIGTQHLASFGSGIHAAVSVDEKPHQVQIGTARSWWGFKLLLIPGFSAVIGRQHQ
ncbi:hypothetical protein D3C71_1806440 [compost metagenome]